MMEIKKSVRFRLMSRKTTDKVSGKKKSKKRNLLIVMTVSYCGNRIGLSTNLHIDEDLWDSKAQRVTGDNLYMRMSEAQINFTLEMLRTGVSSIMYNYERLNIVPTVAQFKKSFESYRISFGQTGWGIQLVPQMAANSIPPIAPLPINRCRTCHSRCKEPIIQAILSSLSSLPTVMFFHSSRRKG